MTVPFHDYANIFELIQGEQFDSLVDDVRRHGVRERIVIHDGKVLDGRNRYLAAIAAGLISQDDHPDDRPALFQRFVPAVDGDPLAFVISKNLHRRHLTVGQRAYALAEVERFRHGGARFEGQDASWQVDRQKSTNSGNRADLASQGEVSERSIARAAVVRDYGVEDLKDAVKRGEVPIAQAEQIARMPDDRQQEEVRRILPNGARAIMGSRQEPDDSLDYFPTPPWATRALCEHVLPRFCSAASSAAWEPACGEGHMAEVLREYFRSVFGSDIHDYGYGAGLVDFLSEDPWGVDPQPDWIITNPPFGDAGEKFVLRAIEHARVGVAMFLRLQWLESIGRYERVFRPHPPAVITQFAERVPLHKGRWEPDGTTATAYLWIVWARGHRGATEFAWIPPDQRKALSRPDDVERFTEHPVIRKQHVVLLPSETLDPETGEIVEAPSPVVAPAPLAAPSDDGLDIPDFLRRTRVPAASDV